MKVLFCDRPQKLRLKPICKDTKAILAWYLHQQKKHRVLNTKTNHFWLEFENPSRKGTEMQTWSHTSSFSQPHFLKSTIYLCGVPEDEPIESLKSRQATNVANNNSPTQILRPLLVCRRVVKTLRFTTLTKVRGEERNPQLLVTYKLPRAHGFLGFLRILRFFWFEKFQRFRLPGTSKGGRSG